MSSSMRVGWLLAVVVVFAWTISRAEEKEAKAAKPEAAPKAQDKQDKDDKEERPEAALRKQLDHASALFEEGRFEEARKEFERATKQDPGSIRAWLGLGWSYWQLGNRPQALKVWNDILKVKPGDPKIVMALAQAAEAQGQWTEALGYYERVIKQNTELHEAHLGKARILLQQQRWPAAEAELKEVLRIAPGDMNAQFELARVYLQTNRRADADRLLKQLAARSPEPKYLRALGDGMLQLGRYDEAAGYYEKSLVRDPDHRGTVLSLSRAYARNHRYPNAVNTLKRYIARHPEDNPAREELAKAAANAGDVAEAEAQFKILIQKNPDDNQWRMRLAKTYRLVGKADQGVAIAKEVVQRDPKDTDALGFLADDAQLTGHDEEAIRWLDQLAKAQPIASRLNQLGRLHMIRAGKLSDQDEQSAAAAEYAAARQAFTVSSKLDPNESDGPLGIVASLRLSGNEDQAIAEAERIVRQHPNLESMRLELFQAHSQHGDFEEAEEHLRQLLKEYPSNVGLEQQLALLDFNEGQRDEGVQRLEGLLRKPLQNRVPILLYHGISGAPRVPSAMPVENFRDQMVTLKRQGYNAITLAQFLDFADGRGALPPKPIFVTFDDARADTIQNADPVLREVGYHAAMFIPAGEIGLHGAYYASWDALADMYKTGRWDMQCHANLGHRTVPVDSEGHEGRFFTDRQWLVDQNRLETEQEFAQRIEEDYRSCREVVERQIPGTKVVGYAYPFGDLGQRRFNNEPNAVKINVELVRKYYRAGFVEAPFGMAMPTQSHERFPRYEMALDSNGEDLMKLLRTADPENSTLYLVAQLYAWSGRFADAQAIYATLEKRGYDKATLLAAQAQALQWNGDFRGARDLFREAAALRPNDPQIARRVESLDLQVAPSVRADGNYYSDNRDRSNFGIGPAGKVYLTDRFSLGAKYQYREFKHDHFNLSQLAAPSGSTTTPTGGTTTAALTQLPAGTTGEADLEAKGNQVEAQLEYQVDGRTGFTISGGVADFDDKSKPRFLPSQDPFPLASGRASLGLSDYSDIAVGASHGYVPSAGTILDGLEYTGGLVQLHLVPVETWSIFAQGIGEVYDDDNSRVSALARLTKLVWRDPSIELGYQFIYDDAREQNPFFYTPDQFIGNEAVFSIATAANKPIKVSLDAGVGEGSERDGTAEVEGSVTGSVEVTLARRFKLILSGGRTQSAKFESFEGRGSLSLKF